MQKLRFKRDIDKKFKKGKEEKEREAFILKIYKNFENFFSLNCFALLRQFSLSGSDCSV